MSLVVEDLVMLTSWVVGNVWLNLIWCSCFRPHFNPYLTRPSDQMLLPTIPGRFLVCPSTTKWPIPMLHDINELMRNGAFNLIMVVCNTGTVRCVLLTFSLWCYLISFVRSCNIIKRFISISKFVVFYHVNVNFPFDWLSNDIWSMKWKRNNFYGKCLHCMLRI